MKKWLLLLSIAALTACATTPPTTAPVTATTPPTTAKQPHEVTTELALVAKVTNLFPDGQVASLVTSTYDADGLLLKEETVNANGLLQESKQAKRSGLTARITTLNASGEPQSIKEVVSNADGLILKETFFNGKDQIQSVNEYSYAKDGQRTVWLTKGASDNLLAKTEYVYEQGYNTKINLYDEKGALTKSFVNGFDGQGHLVQKKELEADGTTVDSVTVFTYQNGRLVKEDVQNDKGSSQRAVEYSLNDKGQPAQATYYDRRAKVVEIKKFDYTYLKKTKMVTD